MTSNMVSSPTQGRAESIDITSSTNLIKVSWGLLEPLKTLTADNFFIGWIHLPIKGLHVGEDKVKYDRIGSTD